MHGRGKLVAMQDGIALMESIPLVQAEHFRLKEVKQHVMIVQQAISVLADTWQRQCHASLELFKPTPGLLRAITASQVTDALISI